VNWGIILFVGYTYGTMIEISIPIIFKYGTEWELKRVLNTLETKDWLTKNGYRFSLPQGLGDFQSQDIDVIKGLIEKEYSPAAYQIAEAAINRSWDGNCRLMKKINEKLVGSYMLNELNIILTKYGTQGSYIQPNSIVINISTIPPEFLIKTVIHESLHLMIETQIRQYDVDHWIKERIVNLIMDAEFKSRFKMDKAPEQSIVIDGLFRQLYPNLDLILKESPHVV